MRITVSREKLITKLRERLHAVTDGFTVAKQARADYETRAVAVARNLALKKFRDPNFDLGRVYIDESGRASISVYIETGEILDPVPNPGDPRRNEVEVLRKALQFFELGTNDEVVLTDKDPYYRYIR